jgi:ADP-ribose pyrophosphatase
VRVLTRVVQDHGAGIQIAEALLRTTEGTLLRRRYLHTPDTVAIVAVLDGHLILIREFRAAVGECVLQLPMGKIDGSRTPLECAHAELTEETGFRAARCEPLGTLLSCPGWMDQTLHVYQAIDLTRGPRTPPHSSDTTDVDVEEALISVDMLPIDEFRAAVADGRVRDARTIAAIYLALGQQA